MVEATRKTGKKGRGLKKPSHKRYTIEKRWEVNKARRMTKQAKFEAKKKEQKEKVALAI